MDVADYPKLRNEARQALFNRVQKRACPVDSSKPMSTEEVSARLKAAMNG